MIAVEDEGDVRVITFDRPDRHNALTPAGLEDLDDAVAGAETPVVYLRGAGDSFCAGADLDTVADVAARHGVADSGTAAGTDDVVATFVRRGQRVADVIETADAVVVAGIDGPARGGGIELALACDIRVATPGATFAEPGVTFGLFGAWGGTVRLPEVLGMGDALDFSLSGRVLDAEEALRVGLVSRITDDPRAVAETVAANDHSALAVVKERIRDRAPKDRQEAREVRAFERLVEEHAGAISDRNS